ncbi:HNH/endonuclease VII fold putative polymorphic toxin [Pseudomonas lactucae]|uniref:HNH/endonuclease VII fold putative polymorphic toxin n=1 Tax=Pseudomonas lactucae TaxID=2813360 RepID=UPI002FCCD283
MKRNKATLTREYEFTRENGSKIVIQEHSAGHKFGAKNGAGDQGAHFNLRPIDTPRTGNIPGTKDH